MIEVKALQNISAVHKKQYKKLSEQKKAFSKILKSFVHQYIKIDMIIL